MRDNILVTSVGGQHQHTGAGLFVRISCVAAIPSFTGMRKSIIDVWIAFLKHLHGLLPSALAHDIHVGFGVHHGDSHAYGEVIVGDEIRIFRPSLHWCNLRCEARVG